jgi:putative transposase
VERTCADEHLFPRRRRPAHPAMVDWRNRATIVFLTVCTRNRKRCLASAEALALICAAWRAADSWRVGRFTILPDHLHLFCAPATFPLRPLDQWINFWRRMVSRSWPLPLATPLWQKDFWDTQLRSGESYAGKWEYVRNNQVRHGLVARASEWPFQGEMNVLPWHD